MDRHHTAEMQSGSGRSRELSGKAGASCYTPHMEGMKLDKAQIARRQLGTALALFIEDLDPVSVHTLACAGGEIAEYAQSGSERSET
jgi:hypothetical protein